MEIVKLKTYKSIETDLVVLVTEDLGDFFSGVVIIGDDEEKVGTYEYKWNIDAFEPYDAELIVKEKSTQLKKGRKSLKNYSNEELYKVLEKVYENKKQVHGLGYTIIVRRLMDLENIGENKAKRLVKQAREVLLIFQQEDLKYILINN
jgi:hypothetical protein